MSSSGSDDGRGGLDRDDREDSYDRFEDDEEPEEEEGEDLMDTMEKDYQYIPELDQYEADGIDDRDHDDMDFGTRRAVNEMLNRRDERARLREQARRGQFIPSDSESEPDEEYLRRKRPRVGPRFDGDPDDPDGDADDPHDEEDNVLDYETLTKTMEFSER
jgi:hypothetical protein